MNVINKKKVKGIDNQREMSKDAELALESFAQTPWIVVTKQTLIFFSSGYSN